MKRRRFVRDLALGAGFAAAMLGQKAIARTSLAQSKTRHPWVVLYWMPYDNDLSRFGEPIADMLAKGTKHSDAVVALQSDYWGDTHMRRRVFANGATQEFEVTAADSSDILNFAAYLDWARTTFEAEHWAVIVVGHGGRINEISPDDDGATRRSRQWMWVDWFADVVSQFNRAIGGRVELLFFQNCHKATLEVVYEVRECARYTLASQLLLGAPNYYYEGFLRRLVDPSVDGREAAIAIMESEQTDMYHSLTLANNRAIAQIPAMLTKVIQLLPRQSQIALPTLPAFRYFGEQHCDLLALLHCFADLNRPLREAVMEIEDFVQSSAIAHHQTSGTFYSAGLRRRKSPQEPLCGLNVYLPDTFAASWGSTADSAPRDPITRYQFLALYQVVDIVGLYRNIAAYPLGSAPVISR
ncbi:MAG: clostripain family protease [Coleofasciculaceae cyanobacterium SM2_3_26]|nr:clostripain family protease [Coleofasciculaceae cyanobacterium SM2_3_26]